MIYPKLKVSIVVPAKNEGEGLGKIIASLKPYAKDIILVDGHSTDNTKSIASLGGVRYVLDGGLGKGEAVRLGLRLAKGEIVVIFDADGSLPIRDIPKLVMPIVNNKADLVIGSRRTGGSFDLNMSIDGILRTFGCDLMAYLVNRKFNVSLSDILFGFRAVRKSIVKDLSLESNGFEIEQETVIKSLKKGYTLLEVPVRENARAWGKSKLKTITGLKLLFFLIKELYS